MARSKTEISQKLKPLRKQHLIEATMSAIADYGMSNLTLAKIAAEAGLTAGSVNFHFDGKQALLLATLQHVTEEFQRTVATALAEADDDPRSKLLAFIDVCFESRLTDARRLAVWYGFLSEASARKDYQKIQGDREATNERIVIELCIRLADEAGDARDVDARAIAFGLMGMIENLWQDMLFVGKKFDRKAARKLCKSYLQSIFPGQFSGNGQSQPLLAKNLDLVTTEDDGVIYTLPSWVYDSQEFFDLETQAIHLPAWQFVCHVNDIAEPGDFETFDFLSERAFVIRGKDGEVRAFHNVCRHRAHAVVQGQSGHCDGVILCPYHGWTYELDGSNRAVSQKNLFEKVEQDKLGLATIDLEIYAGFVFIRFVSGGSSVAQLMEPYADEFAKYRTEKMSAQSGLWEEVQEIDWKNIVENYVEDYHFPTGHKGLAALMERDYERESHPSGVMRLSHKIRENPHSNWSAEKYAALLPVYEHLPEEMRRRWTYFGLFPGVYFDVFPENLDFFHVVPLGPGRSVLRSRYYGYADASREARAIRYLNQRINSRVQNEDNDLTLSVQGGLQSSSYERGILSSKEVIVKGFQDWVRERVPAARLRRAPGPGKLSEMNRQLIQKNLK